MKHDRTVTITLIILFALAQGFGLFLITQSMSGVECLPLKDGETTVAGCTPTYTDTALGERPPTRGAGSLIYILIGVGIGTALLLLLAKYQKVNIWKAWFFLAIWMSSAIALAVILPLVLAWILAGVLAAWKLWRPNLIVYNITEVLMYSGIAVLLVPIFDVRWTIALLLIISLYDAYAVWKSRHMVSMAQFITDSNAFAGLMIPYKPGGGMQFNLGSGKKEERQKTAAKTTKSSTKNSPADGVKRAILGGGDLAFPLLFAGVVLQDKVGKLFGTGIPLDVATTNGLLAGACVSLGAILAVAFLLFFAKKDKFYPAMPFITAGCLLGWAASLLLF